MVNTHTKSANQASADEPTVRIPPKRSFSETLGAIQKLPTPDPLKDQKESTRSSQRRRTNPTPPKLDAKAMIKIVPTLSEKELKQLVNTIVRRRKREEGARNKRPSEPASTRGTTSRPVDTAAAGGNTATVILPPPEKQLVRPAETIRTDAALDLGARGRNPDLVEMKTLDETPRTEEPDLASTLLRHASRQDSPNILFFICSTFWTIFSGGT